MHTNREQSLDHISAAQAARELLREEFAKDYIRQHTVNVLRDDVRHAVKLAEVHALLHIGTQLERLGAGRRTAVELLVEGGADYSSEEPPC